MAHEGLPELGGEEREEHRLPEHRYAEGVAHPLPEHITDKWAPSCQCLSLEAPPRTKASRFSRTNLWPKPQL
eukprot:13720861-Alexandrium_andersonii.AAC.1